jgi:hypothetical protein
METKILFKTEKGNNYLQDTLNNQLIFIPPAFLKIISDCKNKSTINDHYYKNKYYFLKNYLSEEKTFSEMYSGRLTADYINLLIRFYTSNFQRQQL